MIKKCVLLASPCLLKLVASVYMHDRLLARLLPSYGVHYISSLSTAFPPEAGETYQRGDRIF